VWYDSVSAAFGNLWQLGTTGTYWLSLDSKAAGSAGKLQFVAFGADHSELQILDNATATNNGAWHHVVCQYNASTLLLELYVDAVLVDSQTAAATIDPPDLQILLAAAWVGTPFVGGLDEFAVYDHVLTPARISAHYAARTLREGELSGARIGYILDRAGWPATPRNIDAGQSTLAAADLEGLSALEALHRVAESEAGVFFIAGDGAPTFFDRYDRISSPKDVPQATFGDGGGTEVDYEVVELSYDEERIFNEIREMNNQTLVVREDLASQATYGRRTLEQRTDLFVAAEAIDRADFALRRYKDPRVRCETISFGPVYATAEWAVLLGRELGDRVRIMRRPPTGATVERDVFVEQILEGADGDGMRLTYQLSPAEDWNFWVLGHATHGVLGTTTVVGF
ncbi:MAG: LamG domain-containing protein, partial [Chloroflexi bacterium]|nr:LamG domain-containing protein [Chloroflexota bacterium]